MPSIKTQSTMMALLFNLTILFINPPLNECLQTSWSLSRRDAFHKWAQITTAVVAPTGDFLRPGFVKAAEGCENGSPMQIYAVRPDGTHSLNPKLVSLSETAFYKEVNVKSAKGAIWLGEHHNSVCDHSLQVKFIRRNAHDRKGKPTAVGLEQVQVQFQPVLDAFLSGSISVADLERLTEWDKRWMWPFKVYEPLFQAAKELSLPLIALNVDSEDLSAVEHAGFPGLSRALLAKYIPDPNGFADFARNRAFSTYVDYVIEPSYELHQKMGLLRYTMSGEKLEQEMPFQNFLSARILWDEAMASRAFAWTEAHPGGLIIGIVGADHVKFGLGIAGRFARMAREAQTCTSVILNPTLIDSRPPGSVLAVSGADSSRFPERLTLQLRYLKNGIPSKSPESFLPSSTGGILPFADFIVMS